MPMMAATPALMVNAVPKRLRIAPHSLSSRRAPMRAYPITQCARLIAV
jgi:hypothetical protein